MNRTTLLFSLLTLPLVSACNLGSGVEVAKNETRLLYDLNVKTLEGQAVGLDQYRGKVALVVNTASKCGYTSQYEGLQELQERFGDKGFVVLGFPSNDFLGQEPGTPAEIRAFCTEEFGVTFPMFEKVGVKVGAGQSEIYQLLGESAGTLPSWNFGKYLVDRKGQVVEFFGTKVRPTDEVITSAIDRSLSGASTEPITASMDVTGPLLALESNYADFPKTALAGSKTLALNGDALCEWGLLGFNLYRGALYVERTSEDAKELMQMDQTLMVYLHFVRSLSSSQLQDAFRASANFQMGEDSAQEANLQSLLGWMVDVTKGDAMAFVVDDAQALVGYVNGKPMGKIADPNFGKLFIQLYLGSQPPTEALKQGMLGL
ncbi:MAG: glutathione peroxidase [Planctomycetota bacterium]|jgi:glutathione peroxidase